MVNELAELFPSSTAQGNAGASVHRKVVSYELETE
jgi:hypothetical protein